MNQSNNDHTTTLTQEFKKELKTQVSQMLNTLFQTKLNPIQTNIQNNTLNQTLNNTQINNNNQHVKINNYGEEDYSYITKEKYKNDLDPEIVYLS